MSDFLQATVGTSAQTLDGSKSGLITRTGGLWANGTVPVTATTGTNALTNDGYVYAFGGVFPAIDANGAGFDLLNGPDGVITAQDPGSGVIDLDLSDAASLVNHGTIHSPEDEAISFAATNGGADFRLTNTGAITSNEIEAIDAFVGTGLFSLVNAGVISSRGDTVAVSASSPGGATIHTLMNSGTITATIGDAILIFAGSNAAVLIGNSGTLSAWDQAISIQQNAEVTVVNSGLIESLGTQQAIGLRSGDDLIRNTGTIVGDVVFQGGADHLRNSGEGVVIGLVSGGPGDDSLIGGTGDDGFSGGDGDDLLVGNDGNDTLTGGADADRIIAGNGDDSLTGGTGEDILNGGAGADKLSGGAGNDILIGGDGDDILEGGENDDTIDAGAGDDQIEGGDGDDIMRGRAGEDQFKPGLGRDVMTGGQDADTFIFATTAIAGMGPNRDVIQDFEQGIDLINVVAMAPGAFDFIGTSAFSGTGIEIRVTETATGTSIVEFDADGDGTADAQLKITGVLGLTADDFAL